MKMERGWMYSAILHLGVALLLIFGLPTFLDKEVLDSQPLIVEMVQIAEKTNPPPAKPREEAPKPLPKPVEDKPPPPQAKPTPPPPIPEPPQPQQAERAPEPLPKPPEPKPPEVKPEVKKEPPPPPKETATPPPPRQVAKVVPPKRPPPKRDDFLAAILKDVAPTPRAAEKTEKPVPQKTPAPSAAPPSLDQQVSISEIDAVRRQIQECWSMPAGARDAGSLVVTIRATVAPDGTVITARIENTARMNEPYFRAAAESAQRAMLNPRCQPLKLPPHKYEQWRELRLDFNPKDMIG